MDFSWIGAVILIGLVLYVATQVWDSLGLLVGNTATIWGTVMIVGAILCVLFIVRPMLSSGQSQAR